MKLFYTLLLLSSSFYFSQAANYDGYIVTLDGKIIKGKIENIYYADFSSELTFTNTTGSTYTIPPEWVRGFGFEWESEEQLFESKFYRGYWYFLKVIHHGDLVNLYKSVDVKNYFIRELGGYRMVSTKYDEYWIQAKGRKIFRINKLNYKKHLRRKLDLEEKLAMELGTKTCRFEDLPRLVERYNTIYKESKKML